MKRTESGLVLPGTVAKKVEPKLAPAREDGRPLFYDISPGDRMQCVCCLTEGITAQYSLNEGFMNDPANSPVVGEPGAVFTICRGHLPENAVIYNPKDMTCRNKAGDNVWKE
jgi:hypothetical protein